MKQRSIACVVVFVVIEAAYGIVVSAASARPSQPEAMATSDLATMVCDFEVYAFAEESRTNFRRPGFSPECSIEEGRIHVWPCNSPGCDY